MIYQPKESDKHQPNYCDGCDFELFCIIFVKATPEKDENGWVFNSLSRKHSLGGSFSETKIIFKIRVDKPLDTFCETCSISQERFHNGLKKTGRFLLVLCSWIKYENLEKHKSTTLQLDWIVLQQYSLEYLGQIYDKLWIIGYESFLIILINEYHVPHFALWKQFLLVNILSDKGQRFGDHFPYLNFRRVSF